MCIAIEKDSWISFMYMLVTLYDNFKTLYWLEQVSFFFSHNLKKLILYKNIKVLGRYESVKVQNFKIVCNPKSLSGMKWSYQK